MRKGTTGRQLSQTIVLFRPPFTSLDPPLSHSALHPALRRSPKEIKRPAERVGRYNPSSKHRSLGQNLALCATGKPSFRRPPAPRIFTDGFSSTQEKSVRKREIELVAPESRTARSRRSEWDMECEKDVPMDATEGGSTLKSRPSYDEQGMPPTSAPKVEQNCSKSGTQASPSAPPESRDPGHPSFQYGPFLPFPLPLSCHPCPFFPFFRQEWARWPYFPQE